MTAKIGARRKPAPTLLAPGFGTALLMLSALVVFVLIGLALKAAVVAQFAPVVGR